MDQENINNTQDNSSESTQETEQTEEQRSVSGVSVELSREGQRAQRMNPENIVPRNINASQQEGAGMPYGVPAYTGAYQTPYGTYVNPQEEYEKRLEMRKHKPLAVASLVLGGMSIGFFWMYGLGIVLAVIGAVFGFISMRGGKYTTKTMGVVGFILSMVGLVFNGLMIAAIVSVINWDNVTMYNISLGKEIDPSDTKAMMDWIQMFIKADISGYIF